MYIRTYNSFYEESIIRYIDESINESFSVSKIWNDTISKIKNLSLDSKKRILKHLIASMLTISTPFIINSIIQNSNTDEQTKSVAVEVLDDNIDSTGWKKGYEFTLSQNGWNHIKDEEKLRLRAYSIGDGMITIGWGHAEPVSDSQFKVGDRITKELAYSMLKEDLKKTADGVRKIFKEWEQQGINIEINQDMFDALVSIAYNSGIGSLRNSDFIQDIKKGDFKSAGEKIKMFKVSKNFPGLEIRRQKESQMFLASL
jgi:lysozyme